MSLRTELESLKKENDSLYNLYQKYELLDPTIENVKEIKNDFHNIVMNRHSTVQSNK